jgi:hypothetical protein
MVVLLPLPFVIIPPGLRTNVHPPVPVVGKPLNTTLPVARAQPG